MFLFKVELIQGIDCQSNICGHSVLKLMVSWSGLLVQSLDDVKESMLSCCFIRQLSYHLRRTWGQQCCSNIAKVPALHRGKRSQFSFSVLSGFILFPFLVLVVLYRIKHNTDSFFVDVCGMR